MTQLLIQPSGGQEAQAHYENTVRNAVVFADHVEALGPAQLAELVGLFPEGSCAMWGLVPGKNDGNRDKWDRIQPGDVVAFTGKKRVFATAIVKSKFRNQTLARQLWSEDEAGATWEYMYSLEDVTEVDVPYSKFNELLGDNPNNNHMGFRIVADDKAADFKTFIGQHAFIPQPTSEQIVSAIRSLDFDDIQIVVDEWDELGREEFLRVHSLHRAFKYLLVWGDEMYDAKAIAVSAVRLKHPELSHLRANAFSGDYATIAKPLRSAGWEVVDKADVEKASEDDEHEKKLKERANLGPVEKLQLVKARRGQGQFRHNVMLREKRCRVTGVSEPEHLRASHIKPWSKSSDDEKLDGNNGLMLAPHIDHLFDKGWLSFGDDGAIIRSQSCDEDVLQAFGVDVTANVGSFSPEQCHYLDFHRTQILRP